MFFSLLYFILAGVLLLVVRISWLQYKAIKLLKKNNIPVQPLPSVWHFIIKSFLPQNQEFNPRVRWFLISTCTTRLYQKERIFSASIAGTYYVHLFKPEFVEVIMNSNTIINKGWMYKFMEPWLGNGLITSSGENWRKKRKLLTPAFHFKILENFQTAINKHSRVLIEKLKKNREPWMNVTRLMSFCTLDIIAETAMGIEIKAQENEESEYVKAIGKIEELVYKRMMSPLLWPDAIFNISPVGREFNNLMKTIHTFIRQVITEKKKEMQENVEDIEDINEEDSENIYMQSKKKKAFLTLLLHHHLNYKDISEEEIKEEVNTFMFAGHDTTAMGISWALYNIGLYPDIQDKIIDEMHGIFGEDRERPINSKDIRNMKYLDCVLKESLRIYPSVPSIVRTASEELKLNDKMTIPKGSSIHIDIYSMHHDPELYQNPEIFDPDRFLPENATGRNPYAFIPFSAGSRNCIGQRFALMEEKIVIANILRQFRIRSLDQRDKITECGELILRPINEPRMQFVEK